MRKYHMVLRTGEKTSICPAHTCRYVSCATVAYWSPPLLLRMLLLPLRVLAMLW